MPLLPWVACSPVLLPSLQLLVWLLPQLLLPVVRQLRSLLLQPLMQLLERVVLMICHSKRQVLETNKFAFLDTLREMRIYFIQRCASLYVSSPCLEELA